MERELSTFAEIAKSAQNRSDHQYPSPESVAGKVYASRTRSLVPGVAILPAILGCLFLSSGMGLLVSSTATAPGKMSVESISPNNSETIWEKEVKPLQGREFHLTLDLRNTLKATDARTLRVLWSQPMPRIASTSAPIVFADRERILVSVATSIGAVYLLNGITGQVLWMQNVSDRVDVSPIQIKNTVLAVACADGKIYGLNVADGRIDYMIQTDSVLTALEPVADGRGEHLYAIADKKRILALNAMTGDLQWRGETAGIASDSPILAANKIITPTADGNSSKLWAFDEKGNLRWMNTFAKYNSLVSTEGYIAMAQGSIITLIKAETGEPVHYWQLGHAPEQIELSEKNGLLIVKTDQGNLTSVIN